MFDQGVEFFLTLNVAFLRLCLALVESVDVGLDDFLSSFFALIKQFLLLLDEFIPLCVVEAVLVRLLQGGDMFIDLTSSLVELVFSLAVLRLHGLSLLLHDFLFGVEGFNLGLTELDHRFCSRGFRVVLKLQVVE